MDSRRAMLKRKKEIIHTHLATHMYDVCICQREIRKAPVRKPRRVEIAENSSKRLRGQIPPHGYHPQRPWVGSNPGVNH